MINFKTVFLLKEWPKCTINKLPGQSVTRNQILGVAKLWALNTWILNHRYFFLISTMVLMPVCTLDSPGSLIKMELPGPHSQSLCLWFNYSSWALDIFFFRNSFRFIAVLARGTEVFHSPPTATYAQPPHYQHPPPEWTYNEMSLSPRVPVYLRVHSWWCAFYGSGTSPRGGNGNPLQYSCLGNPMDRVG